MKQLAILLQQLATLLLLATSVLASAAPPVLTDSRRQELLAVHFEMLVAIHVCNLDALDRVFTEKRAECNEFFSHFIAPESPLFEAIFLSGCPQAIDVFEKHRFEMESSPLFLYLLEWYSSPNVNCGPRFLASLDERRMFPLELADRLVDKGFIVPDDLWSFAANKSDFRLLRWLLDKNANINFHFAVNPNFKMSVIAAALHAAVRTGSFDFFLELLRLGVDVNSSPYPGFENVWHYALSLYDDNPHLKEIAALTTDLFSFLRSESEPNTSVKFDVILSEEVMTRIKDGRLVLGDESNEEVLDLVLFKFAGLLPQTAIALYHAGFKTKVPFTCAVLLGDVDTKQRMIATGEADFNESIFGKSLLLNAVEFPHTSIEDISLILASVDAVDKRALVRLLHTHQSPPQILIEALARRLSYSDLEDSMRRLTIGPKGTEYLPFLKQILDEIRIK